MTVLFFHTARALAQTEEWQITLAEPMNEDQFWCLLTECFPALNPLRDKVRLAKNQVYLEHGGMQTVSLDE